MQSSINERLIRKRKERVPRKGEVEEALEEPERKRESRGSEPL